MHTVVSKHSLLERLNSELRKHDVCDGCRFTGIVSLRENDSNGCNWSANLECGETPGSICGARADKIVAQAKAFFNLRGDSAVR
jgi:hypothetical protein